MLKGGSGYLGSAELEAKRAGHIMGIKGGAAVKESPYMQTFVAQTETSYNDITAQYVQEKLNLYTPESNKDEWAKIRKMFNQTATEAKIITQNFKYLPGIAANQVKQYQANEPVHICSGWSGHHIGVSFYKGYLIVSNRGEGGVQNEGTIIYKLKRDITAQDLLALQRTLNEPGVKQADIQAKLSELQGPKIASFPQKPQKYGTCSYVNKIASTEALLCLLSLDKQNNLNDTAIGKYAANNQNRAEYKAFTNANRESEINRIIGLIEQASARKDDKQLAVMVNIAFSIALKYQDVSDDPSKDKTQVNRANRLLQAISKHQAALTTDNKKQYQNLKGTIENRALAQQPIPFGDRPLDSALKEQIANKINGAFNIMDRVPIWYFSLSSQMDSIKTFDEMVAALDKALKVSPKDEKLRELNMDVRAMLRDAAKINVPQPLPPVSPVQPPVAPVRDATFDKLLKEISGFGPVFSYEKAVVMPPWYGPLLGKLSKANNVNDIMSTFSDLKQHLGDPEFSKMVDKSFEALIRQAKDINEIINIVDKYPKDTIVSPSGSTYDPKAIVALLKQTPLPLSGVTAALGIRDKVASFQGPKLQDKKVDDAPFRLNLLPMKELKILKDNNQGSDLLKNIKNKAAQKGIEEFLKNPVNFNKKPRK